MPESESWPACPYLYALLLKQLQKALPGKAWRGAVTITPTSSPAGFNPENLPLLQLLGMPSGPIATEVNVSVRDVQLMATGRSLHWYHLLIRCDV
jgi:hypothetical protein